MLSTLILFADEAANKTGEPGPIWQNPIFLMLIVFGLFYFIVLRPHRSQRRRLRSGHRGGRLSAALFARR